jgi:hypothetical protein
MYRKDKQTLWDILNTLIPISKLLFNTTFFSPSPSLYKRSPLKDGVDIYDSYVV